MNNVISLVAPAAPAADTVASLEYLLAEARAGRLVGLAWIALKAGNAYEVDIADEAALQPEYVRGLARVLDDQLAKLIGSRELHR
jgi:hypothetical protein